MHKTLDHWSSIDLKLKNSTSGVATGWHGWTMSMGPGAKGAPERETKKKQKNRKEKNGKRKKWRIEGKKETKERKFSNTRTGAHTQYIWV